jgi:hypothetical protein
MTLAKKYATFLSLFPHFKRVYEVRNISNIKIFLDKIVYIVYIIYICTEFIKTSGYEYSHFY